MTAATKDGCGRYRQMHSFISISGGHMVSVGALRICEVREYKDGSIRVECGEVFGMNDLSHSARSIAQIYAEAKLALECELESPK